MKRKTTKQKAAALAREARKLLAFTAEIVEACDYGHEEFADLARDLRRAIREARHG